MQAPTNLFELLLASESGSRRYRTKGYYLQEVLDLVGRMTNLAERDPWTPRIKVIDSVAAGDEANVFELANFILWEEADTDELLEFCNDLPEDFLAFFSSITCGLLCYDNFTYLMPPDTIPSTDRRFRNKPRIDPSGKPSLVRFAYLGNKDYFALRRHDSEPKRWQVTFAVRDWTTEYHESPEGEEFVCDESFTAWLQRMIETEANPLLPRYMKPGEKDANTRAKRIG